MALLDTLLLLMLIQTPATAPPRPPELNAAMMDSTVKITGPSAKYPTKASIGTGFIVGRPAPTDPKRLSYILVTAAHVLNDIQGETATLVLRVKTPTAGYQRTEHRIAIRNGSAPLWSQHPTADVAVVYVALPGNRDELIPQDYLATDADFEKYEIRPGDEVLAVGYPNGLEANNMGFPILRSGRIASFPLVPAAKLESFLVDFAVFGGNSGGPVYINEIGRLFGNTIHMDQRVFCILGLVSRLTLLPDSGEHMGVAVVVHAQFIKEAIALLPPQSEAEAIKEPTQ